MTPIPGALTLVALAQHGYAGFFEEANRSVATRLLMTDLFICLTLITVWMILDARRRRRTVWPFVALSALFGAAGPLLYLIVRGEGDRDRGTPAAG